MTPGAGFACGPDAMLALDSDPYCPPSIGTIGRLFVDRTGRKFGVSCGHCLRFFEDSFHDHGVIVHQPCAMGHILNTCTNRKMIYRTTTI